MQNPESYLLGLLLMYGPIFPVHSYGDRPPRKKSQLLKGCSLDNPTSDIVCGFNYSTNVIEKKLQKNYSVRENKIGKL